MPMPEVLDRRVAMEEAFASAEADAKGEEYVPPVHETEHPEAGTGETEAEGIDPAKIEAHAEAKPVPKDRPRTRGVPPDERGKLEVVEKPVADPAADPAKVSALDKAPIGWGPKRAELWARVPTDVRSVISKRELEIQQGMSQAGTIRKIAEEYHQVIMPFENVIRSMNSTPREAIKNVMTTATALIIGTQAQKCAVLAEMIQRYGVDLPELDKVLTAAVSGKGNGQGQRQQQQEAALDPRILHQLQPLFQLQSQLAQQQGQRQQQLEQEAATAINSIVNEPYYEDVRDDMADILEISAKRGVVLTIQQAYQKAVQINPEVSKLVNPKGRTPADAVARARRTASTVRGAPGGPVTNGKLDRRSAIEAAWDSV